MEYKRFVFVGGISDTIKEQGFEALFIPFGPIKSLEIPKESVLSKLDGKTLTRCRGFGFIEFEEEEDAEEAVFNMDSSIVKGRVLRVSIAPVDAIKVGQTKPSWHEMNDWYRKKLNEEGFLNDEEAKDNETNF
eukprot:snap_masked-scaffold_20-processed-gene-5.82-mRNA-1 protein AED:0.03 eAED:0.03 QI:0/-1/0/1/-1/1/1/0/132